MTSYLALYPRLIYVTNLRKVLTRNVLRKVYDFQRVDDSQNIAFGDYASNDDKVHINSSLDHRQQYTIRNQDDTKYIVTELSREVKGLYPNLQNYLSLNPKYCTQ